MPDLAISENFGDLLDPRFRKIFDKEYEENIKESMAPMLYGISSSTRSEEKFSSVGGMSDIGTFNGSIDYDSFDQLYDISIEFPERAGGFKVERKLADDDQFGIMDRRPWQMAIATARTREKSAATLFNGAFTGTDGPDSLPLCSASHPYSPNDSTVMSNAGSTALSATAVEATRRIGHTSIYNDRGELMLVNYDTILCTVNNEETAWAIINSKGQVETANNNRNFHYGRYNLAVWDRLTDSNNWFLIDSKLVKMFNHWIDRIKPEFNYDRDFDTLVSKWSVYMRYGTGFSDWRWCYGHNVA